MAALFCPCGMTFRSLPLALALLIAPALELHAQGRRQPLPPGSEETAMKKPAQTYSIDGHFEAFSKKLIGQERWMCKIITGGGITQYEAKDSAGQWYAVRLVSGGTHQSTIEKKRP